MLNGIRLIYAECIPTSLRSHAARVRCLGRCCGKSERLSSPWEGPGGRKDPRSARMCSASHAKMSGELLENAFLIGGMLLHKFEQVNYILLFFTSGSEKFSVRALNNLMLPPPRPLVRHIARTETIPRTVSRTFICSQNLKTSLDY